MSDEDETPPEGLRIRPLVAHPANKMPVKVLLRLNLQLEARRELLRQATDRVKASSVPILQEQWDEVAEILEGDATALNQAATELRACGEPHTNGNGETP